MTVKEYIFSKFNKSTVVEKTAVMNNIPKGFRPLELAKVVDRNTIPEIYKNNAEVNAITNYIAEQVAELIIKSKHIRKSKSETSDSETMVKNSTILKLLNNPNEFDNAYNFWKSALVYFICTGNTYLNKVKPVGYTDYSKIYTLDAVKTYIICNDSTDQYGTLKPNSNPITLEITYFNQLLDSSFIRYNVEDIIHIKDSSIDSPIYGSSRLYSALKNAEILNGINDTINTVTNQGGALGMIKKNQKNGELVSMDPAEKQRIEDAFYSYGVKKGKKPILFTSEDLQYIRILTSIAEFLPTEITELELKSICRSLGGIPDILFSSSDGTFNNLKEAQKIANTNIFIPLACNFLNSLKKGLELPENEYLEVDYDNIECLKADEKADTEIENAEYDLYIKMYKDGIIDRFTLLEKLDLSTQGQNNGYYKINTSTSPTT